MMDIINAAFSSADHSTIDCEMDHPVHGWISTTLTAADYPEYWEKAIASGPAPFVEPTDAEQRAAWRSVAVLSRSQFALAVYRAGVLPLEEAISAGKGDWPASFTPLLEAMPEGIDPAEAQILWAGITQVDRLHPLFEAVRQFKGITPQQADTMFGYKDEGQ